MNVIWSIFRLPGQSPISLSKQGSQLSSKRHGDFGRETGRGSLPRISRVAGGLPGPGPSPGGGRSDTKTICRLQGTWSFPGFHYDLADLDGSDDLDAYAAYAGSFSAYSRQIIVETCGERDLGLVQNLPVFVRHVEAAYIASNWIDWSYLHDTK